MKKSHDTVRASWESSRRRREVNGIKADDQNDSRLNYQFHWLHQVHQIQQAH
jgi:hypothetical protein